MATLGDVTDRIADDLNRSDLSSQIQKAINRAIAHYAKEPFWFTETSASFTLSSSQTSYGAADPSAFPTDVERIVMAEVLSNGSYYELDQIPINEVQNFNPNSSIGLPISFAWYQNRFWPYPIPNSAYVTRIWHTKNYTALTSTASSNDFTTYAEDLIEARARWWVYSRVLKDQPNALVAKQEEAEALDALRSHNENRQSGLKINPTCF